jgi:excisionase family DNA binding protein
MHPLRVGVPAREHVHVNDFRSGGRWMTERLLISKKEAATMLGLSMRTLNTLIAMRELPVRRIGRRRLIERRSLEQFAHVDHNTKSNCQSRREVSSEA